MGNSKKALNFDLRTQNLKRFYPGSNYLNAYDEIKHFLCSEGFTHRQWSGYASERAMSNYEITMLTKKLLCTFPWLSKCVSRFDVTDIGRQYDLTYLFKDCPDVCKEQMYKKQESQFKSMTESEQHETPEYECDYYDELEPDFE